MSYRYDEEVLPEEDTGENFFLRHWRGHLSLPKSWFLVGGALSTVLVQVLLAGVLMIESGSSSLRFIAAAWLTFFALFLLLRVWASVGIWRSAGKHEARGGAAGWAHVARGLLVIGVLASLAQAKAYGLQVLEYANLAAGHDSLGAPASVTAEDKGREIHINGTLTQGTADRFEKVAKALPSLSSVHLESNGGRIFEAQRMADYVRQRALSTRVESNCESACTLVLLAGTERYAGLGARIGFHQPDFPGYTSGQRQAAIQENSRAYVAAGMDPSFVTRAMQTAPNDMWYPTHDELVQARVITGDEMVISRDPAKDSVGRAIQATVASVNHDGPVNLDESTKLLNAEADGHVLILNHQILVPVDPSRSSALRTALRPDITQRVCADNQSKAVIEAGGKYVFRYQQNNGRPLFEIIVSRCA